MWCLRSGRTRCVRQTTKIQFKYLNLIEDSNISCITFHHLLSPHSIYDSKHNPRSREYVENFELYRWFIVARQSIIHNKAVVLFQMKPKLIQISSWFSPTHGITLVVFPLLIKFRRSHASALQCPPPSTYNLTCSTVIPSNKFGEFPWDQKHLWAGKISSFSSRFTVSHFNPPIPGASPAPNPTSWACLQALLIQPGGLLLNMRARKMWHRSHGSHANQLWNKDEPDPPAPALMPISRNNTLPPPFAPYPSLSPASPRLASPHFAAPPNNERYSCSNKQNTTAGKCSHPVAPVWHDGR